MSLLAYNLTGSPLTLVGGNPPPTLPASGEAMNVTAELRGLNDNAYADLKIQQIDQVRYAWTGAPEYHTGLLQIQTAGGSGSSDIIYRESEPNPSGNVFNTFKDAWSAAKAVNGPSTIWFDDSINDPFIPGWGFVYDLRNVTLRGVRGGCADENVDCDVADGARFTRFNSVKNLNMFYWGSDGPAVVDLGRGGRHLSFSSGPTDGPDFFMTLDGLAGMTSSDVGQVIEISGSDANDGSYTIVEVLSFTSVLIQSESGTSPDANNGVIRWTFSDVSDAQSCTLASAVLADSGGGGWWDLHNSFLTLTMSDGAALWNDDDQVVHYDSGSLLVITASGNFTQIGSNTLSGDGMLLLLSDSKLDFDPEAQDVGSFDWNLLDTSSQVYYNPDNSGDWTEGSPSEVAEALDTLAARSLGTPTTLVVSSTVTREILNLFGAVTTGTVSLSALPAGFRLVGVSFEEVTLFDDPTHGSLSVAIVADQNVAHVDLDVTAASSFPQQGDMDSYFGALITGGPNLVFTSTANLDTLTQGQVRVVITGVIA